MRGESNVFQWKQRCAGRASLETEGGGGSKKLGEEETRRERIGKQFCHRHMKTRQSVGR